VPTENYELVGSYNNQQITSIDGERSINLYEYIDPRGKKQRSLNSTSGLINTNYNLLASSGGFRAQFVFQAFHYMVVGNSVLRVDSTGTVIRLGTLIGTVTGYVGIDANTFQVIFVDGDDGYIWDTIAATFSIITDTSFPAQPIDVCYLDGFFVVAAGGTNNFQLSSFNQGMVWGSASNVFTTSFVALPNQLIVGASTISGVSGTANFATGIPVTLTLGVSGSLAGTGLAISTTYFTIFVDATHIKLATTYANAIAGTAIAITANVTPTVNLVSAGQLQQASIISHPGTIVACRTLHRRLFLFSQFYTEVWENSGQGTNLPFRRNNALLIEFGTPAIGSISVGFDKLMFLSQNRDSLGSVQEIDGTQPMPASTRALDSQLAQYAAVSSVADCRAFMVKENGMIFYRMNFTIADHTFVYNVTLSNPAGGDEEKLWHEEETYTLNRHYAQTQAYFNGLNYVGDYKSPLLYVLDPNTYNNNGEIIPRKRIGKPIVPAAYQRTRIDRFQIDVVQGNVALLDFTQVPVEIITDSGFAIATETGAILITDQTQSVIAEQFPEVFLTWSKDGGQTFGFQLVAPMGTVGNRSYRTVWRKLGVVPRGQAFVPKIEYFNTGPFILMGASWAYETLPE